MILKDYGSPISWWTLWAYAQISRLLQPLPKEKGTVVERKGLTGNQAILRPGFDPWVGKIP